MVRKEKDYLAVAKRNVTRPSIVKGRRRILVYGRNKKGKSTLANSAGVPTTLVIDAEHGTDAMLKNDPYVWHVARWEDMQDVLGALRLGTLSPALLGVGSEKEPFSWVNMDGLTRFNNMALRYIMRMQEEQDLSRRPGIVDRRDYNKSGELMKELLMQMHALPINIVYTAQERMKAITADSDDEESEVVDYVLVPDLPDGVRGASNSWVEVIGRIYVVRIEGKPERRLYIGPNDKYDTGFRSDFVLPDVVRNPTLPKLVRLMEQGPPPKKAKPVKNRAA